VSIYYNPVHAIGLSIPIIECMPFYTTEIKLNLSHNKYLLKFLFLVDNFVSGEQLLPEQSTYVAKFIKQCKLMLLFKLFKMPHYIN